MFNKIKKELNLYFGKIKGYGTYHQFFNKKLTAPVSMVLLLLLLWGLLRPDAINSALLFGIILMGTISVVMPLLAYILCKVQMKWSSNSKKGKDQ